MDKLVIEFETKIDALPLKSPLLNNPKEYNIWNILTAHEDIIMKYDIQYANSSYCRDNVYDKSKYGLMYALRWINQVSKKGDKFRIPKKIHKHRLKQAKDLIYTGVDYQGVTAALTMYHKGLAKAEVINEKTIKFSSNKSEIKYDALDKIISLDLGENTLKEVLNEMSRSKKSKEVIGKIFNSIKLYNDSIKYVYNQEDVHFLNEYHRQILDEIYNFPDNWCFKGIHIGKFRDFWITMTSILTIHSACNIRTYQKGFLQNGSASFVYNCNAQELITQISKITNIPIQDIELIFNLYKYDEENKQSDPALQPFFEYSKDHFLIAPQLYLASRHERNLMSLLSKSYKCEYDQTTNILEEKLIKEIISKISTNNNFSITNNKKIKYENQSTDLDLAIYDTSCNYLLLVELKWVIQPSEVSEKISRFSTERKGILQISIVKEYAKKNFKDFWMRCFPNIKVPKNTKIIGCVAMKGFTGSNKNYNDEIPVIEESLLTRKLVRSKGLDDIYDWLQNRLYLPVEGIDYKLVETKNSVGPYNVIWNGYELIRK